MSEYIVNDEAKNTNENESEHSSYGQIAYYPTDVEIKPKKRSFKRFLLKAFAVIVAAAVISGGSIYGYKLYTENDEWGKYSSVNNDSGTNTDNNPTNEEENPNREIPTLIQLATPDDAMKLPDIVDKVSPAVVGISSTLSNGTATGTGIIMSDDGYIITNAHVIEGAKSITVVVEEKDSYVATVIGSDTQTDLAVIKIDAEGLTEAEFGKSSSLRVGEVAIAIGNPLGFELSGSVTAGIVSAINRTLSIENYTMKLIQTDAAINAGNSGGPLINAYGQVIGINSAKITSSSGDVEGLGFAIPIDEATPIISDLVTYGYVKGRPVLGISGEDIPLMASQYYKIPQGVLVRMVSEGTGAEAAGIQVGDIIVGIEGQTIKTMAELNSIKANYSAGESVVLSICREGRYFDVEVVLSELKGD